MINGFALLRFGLDTLNGTFPCDQRNTVTPSFLFSHDIPAVIILILVVLCYGVTLYRMMKQRKAIGVQTVRNVEIPIDNSSKKNIRMCKNVITLGAIIGLTLVATLPRSIAVFFSYSVEGSESALNFVWIANHVFVLLNPLFDPMIYAFTMLSKTDIDDCSSNKPKYERERRILILNNVMGVNPFDDWDTIGLKSRFYIFQLYSAAIDKPPVWQTTLTVHRSPVK
ncbi:unnamed protein product [Mytilus coruscus]|uniref:G-protein coupled receptors family 1 profile domain-containing protein n=1 Tax=Mytilus coruscus TaxID=42192 RepID=A0A6J8BM84_MYTCO|nr:unnamed protein product [Mytilus coruscus]